MNHADRFAPLRGLLPPIHPDGWPFIALGAVVTLILFLIWQPLGWIGLAGTIWVAAFFRDPWRVSPQAPGIALAPADGLIVALDQAPPPPELEMGEPPMLRIGIALGPFDGRVNRAPLAGRVTKIAYRRNSDGERNAIRVASARGAGALVEIAGGFARRIRCDVIEGQEVIAGQRLGLTRFGARAELYVPADWMPLVAIGQRTIAGETMIAAAPDAGLPSRTAIVTH